MSDTPETDAAVKESSKWRRPLISASFDGVTWDGPVTALCRKLERERDEAREVFVEIRDWIDVASTRPICAFSMDEVAHAVNSWGDKIRTILNK